MDFISKIDALDKSVYLMLNGANAPWLDPVMQIFSNREIWIFLYVGVIVWIGMKRGWRTALNALLFMVIALVLTDQVCNLLKNSVGRLRPSHCPELNGITHQLEDSGGLYGFPSGHAANTFGYAMISAYVIRKKGYSWFIFIWASLVSYSRIYVGKHYPADVLVGVVLGLLIGWLEAWLFSLVEKRIQARESRSMQSAASTQSAAERQSTDKER
jgi:undecaprenyl-diphosphatase